jgi:hypothetical protein
MADDGDQLFRGLFFGVLCLLAAAAIQLTDPGSLNLGVRLLVLMGSYGFGRALQVVGVPAVLTWLSLGLLAGPHMAALAQAALGAFPLPQGLLQPLQGPQPPPLRLGALAIAMLWIGRSVRGDAEGGELRGTAAIFTAHLLTAIAVTAGIVWIVSGPLAAGATSGLVQSPQDVGELIVALVGTSALITGAVLHGSEATGPLSRTLLRLALLGEVAGLVAVVVWTYVLGSDELAKVVVGGEHPTQVLYTAGMGVFAGIVTVLGVRAFPNTRTATQLGVLLLSAAVAAQAGVSVALIALVMGLALAAFTPKLVGDDFIDWLAGPAFAILFTFAGAELPIAEVLPALLLASAVTLMRVVVLLIVAVSAARLVRSGPMLVRWGWTGLLASSLPAAGLVTWDPTLTDGSTAELLRTLWGVAAVDGLLGSIMVHLALRASGEAMDVDPVLPAPEGPADAWIEPATLLVDPVLRDHADELKTDLLAMARTVREEGLQRLLDDADDHLDGLRREARRFHRRATTVLGTDDDPRDAMRRAALDLADAWRSHVLDHAARSGRITWNPSEMTELLDRIAESSPETLTADPLYRPSSTDPIGAVLGALSVTPSERKVPVREIYRYHLADGCHDKLEPAPARLINLELDLAAHSRALFLGILERYLALDDAEALPTLERQVQAEFEGARMEVRSALDETVERLEAVLRRVHRNIVADLAIGGSYMLPGGTRVRPVAGATAALSARYAEARRTCRARYDVLSLEIELTALELLVDGALEEHGSQVARRVRGKGAR